MTSSITLRLGELKRLFWTVLICLIFFGCKGTKKFQSAKNIDSIDAYEQFIDDKPKSPYVLQANERLKQLYEEKMWVSIESSTESQDFEAYLKTYPRGNHASEATTNIERIQLERDWSVAETINSEPSYTKFIEDHPLSSEAQIAKQKIEEVQFERDWSVAERDHTIQGYEEFERMHPDSKYHSEIISTLLEMEALLLAKEKAEGLNSIKANQDYGDNSPSNRQATIAGNRDKSSKESEWQKVKASGNVSSIRRYLKDYPSSSHHSEAEKLLIDFEVDEIFKGDHGKMPPMEKVGGSANIHRNEVRINNNTDYVLTVRCSGNESQKIVMQPGKSASASLSNGKYKIAASVNSSSVNSFTGSVNLKGAIYESTYYIKP
jgi:hypothetical protein